MEIFVLHFSFILHVDSILRFQDAKMASLGMEVSEEISATDSVHQDLGHSALMTPGNDDGSFAVRITPLSSFVSNLPNSFSCHSQSAEPRLKMAISPSQPDDLVVCIEQNMLNCHRLVFPENRGRYVHKQLCLSFVYHKLRLFL